MIEAGPVPRCAVPRIHQHGFYHSHVTACDARIEFHPERRDLICTGRPEPVFLELRPYQIFIGLMFEALSLIRRAYKREDPAIRCRWPVVEARDFAAEGRGTP